MKRKHINIIFFVSIVIILFAVIQVKNMNTKSIECATWIWDTSILNQETILNRIEENNIRKIYLYIDINKGEEELYNNIKFLKDNNIEVELLFGDPNYIFEKEEAELEKIYSFIEGYNQRVEDAYSVKTIHVDVEPHSLKQWDKKKEEFTLLYQIYLDKLIALFKDYTINVDIAFWYDEVIYDNEFGKGNLFEFINNRVDGITVMAYNDDADFIIEVISNEVAINDKIEIAVEYGDIDEINTTFFDKGKEFMYQEISKIRDKYENIDIAIHKILQSE